MTHRRRNANSTTNSAGRRVIWGMKYLLLVAIAALIASPIASAQERRVAIPVHAKESVTVISALPKGEKTDKTPEFASSSVRPEEGKITLELGTEPVWILDGTPPEKRTLATKDSPFGFHPADAPGVGYGYAREIGVDWDRGGLYLMWVLCQPDARKTEYVWEQYDAYFRKLPDGMTALKNITVAHDGMVKRPGQPEQPGRKKGRKEVDVSAYLEGTTYRPKDVKAYQAWVRAAVERYDGDGKEDMPGLKTPAKYWQVDNEPPRGREGYGDLVRITAAAIKEADPEAKVVVGGLIPPYGMLTRAYEKESLPILRDLKGKDVDVIDFHWFGLAGEWREMPEAIDRARRDMKECGFAEIPIWFAEMGTHSGSPKERRDRKIPAQSERLQAAEMVKRHAVARAAGVEKIFWAWGMEEGFMAPDDNDFFDNTGFVYDGLGPGDPGKGTRKIVFWSYQRMTQLLRGWDGSRPEKIAAGDGVHAYRFRSSSSPDAPTVIVAWKEQ